jgi:hypothetical protein
VSALRRNTVTAFEGLAGDETAQILAAFALGGDAGMRPTAVARTLEVPRCRINTAVGRLAAGGVVDGARSGVVGSVRFVVTPVKL